MISGLNYLEIDWNPNPEPDIRVYDLYRSLEAEGEYNHLNYVWEGTRYIDSGLNWGDVYYYKVSAINEDFIESGKSDYKRGMVGAITAWMTDYRGPAGSEVALLINATHATGISYYGLDVQFTYDSDLLTPIIQVKPERETVEKTILTEGMMVGDNSEEASGQLNITGVGLKGYSIVGQGHLFDVKFKVSKGALPSESCEHVFVTVKFKDEDRHDLLVEYSSRATFTVDSDYIIGDVNGDEVVDSADVLLALQFATEEVTPTVLQRMVGDLNGENRNDAADVVMILRKAVELPINPPATKIAMHSGDDYTLNVPDSWGLPGEIVRIPISIDQTADLAGLDFDFSYEPKILEVLRVEKTELTSKFSLDDYDVNSSLKLAMAHSRKLSGAGGGLTEVIFRVRPEALIGSQCELNLTYTKLSGQWGEDLGWYSSVFSEGGVFTVGAQPSPSPTPTVSPATTPTPSPTSPAPSFTPTPSPITPTPTPPITPTPAIVKCFQVAGRVVDKDTGEVVSGASVRVGCPDRRSAVENTGTEGDYEIEICTHFEDGNVRAWARTFGYLPDYADASYINWADERVVSMADIELKTDSISSTGIVSGDYDGDGVSDIAIFRPSSGLWAIRGISRLYFGVASDLLVPADYDGDGEADVGIFRPASGLWAIRSFSQIYYGTFEDIPVPGDYSGSGTAEIGIFRGSSGLWSIRSVTRVYFGARYDQPAPGDYDGDGSWDQVIFRSSSGLWALRQISRIYFGNNGDRLVPGDYDGFGFREPGIFRPASGLWAIRGVTRIYFGKSGDLPVPADYGGIGVDEIGIFRRGGGLWAIRGTTRAYFGVENDKPATR